MKITNASNNRENWNDTLSLWNRVVNWSHYKTSQSELKIQIKSLIVLIWSEKEWLKEEHENHKKYIEQYIDDSEHIKIIVDLANTIKHRSLNRKPRSEAKQTEFYGKITFNNNSSREMIYIDTGNGEIVELLSIIRGSLDEFEDLFAQLHKL